MPDRRIATRRALLAALITFGLLSPPWARAAVLFVDANVPDVLATDGLCSLREAVINTNDDAATWPDCPAGTGADEIQLGEGTYYFAAPVQLPVTGSLLLAGAGADRSEIYGGSSWPVILIDGSAVATIADLAIRGGRLGILSLGSFRLERGWVHDSVSRDVCGSHCGSCEPGLGVAALGPTEILDSTLSGNSSACSRAAGALFCFGGATTTVRNTTISRSDVAIECAEAAVHQATIVDNGSVGIFGEISNSLLSGNTGICGNDGSGGHNLDADGICGLTDATDLPNLDPRLGPLADNGGGTPTHALLRGSPAIDAIPVADCTEPVDQRGIARPQGAACDIGAFERVPLPPGSICGFGPEIPLLLMPLLLARGRSRRQRRVRPHHDSRTHPGHSGV